jgi:hypothetical protein
MAASFAWLDNCSRGTFFFHANKRKSVFYSSGESVEPLEEYAVRSALVLKIRCIYRKPAFASLVIV